MPPPTFLLTTAWRNAKAIGEDPESTVDDLCPSFPHGDLRAELVIRGHAEIIGDSELQWCDHAPPTQRRSTRHGRERAAAAKGTRLLAAAFSQMFVRGARKIKRTLR